MTLTAESLPDFDLDGFEDETEACIRRAEIAALLAGGDQPIHHTTGGTTMKTTPAICRACGNPMDGRPCTISRVRLAEEYLPRLPYGPDRRDRCGDCGVGPGGFHHDGCDEETCPCCHGQLIGCACLGGVDVKPGAAFHDDQGNYFTCTACDHALMAVKVTDHEVNIDAFVFACPTCRKLWIEGWHPESTEFRMYERAPALEPVK